MRSRAVRLCCRRSNVLVLAVVVALAVAAMVWPLSSPPPPSPPPPLLPRGSDPSAAWSRATPTFEPLDVPPFTILDATSFTSTSCLAQLLSAHSEPTAAPGLHPPTEPRTWCPLPFQAWVDVVHDVMPRGDVSGPPPGVRCDLMTPRCAGFAAAPGPATTAFTCPGAAGDSGGDEVTCHLTENLRAGPSAAAVVVSHVGLSSPGLYGDAERLHRLLFPVERTLANQVWALNVMYESVTYYPAGADVSVLSQFNYTYGSGRDRLAGFQMSYMPNWSTLAAPLDLAAKEAAGRPLRRAPVVWITSNCQSRSGREAYVQSLMGVLAIDSFGKCLNNRDPGEYELKADYSNWASALAAKHRLLFAYKFVLVIENSFDYDYVTEKIFDAWESQAVPLYLGAPNIAQYAPGPQSFIDLRNMSVAEVASLVNALDADPAKYQEYHAWRAGGVAAVRANSPLGATLAEHDAAKPMCHVCRLAHRATRGDQVARHATANV